ncbi:hypothetical protein PanWU01x14_205940 [Parasponia andersonii]|uniref:Uncharacterized protein n=1 Tax=Parasponia andersonii TaxID=3476 RepID=A0A2P5BVV6_PARAD|nr:hypothetical protein PanWU01x14_205940 [Parasponia andersonii]
METKITYALTENTTEWNRADKPSKPNTKKRKRRSSVKLSSSITLMKPVANGEIHIQTHFITSYPEKETSRSKEQQYV